MNTPTTSSLEEQVFLDLQRTADQLMYGFAQVLKDADISPAQYNVLRILRGAGKEGLSCTEVGRRLVTAVPDVTRLLDRLEARKLVLRSREGADRRVITVSITKLGLEMVGSLDIPVQAKHREQFAHLGRNRLLQLQALLDLIRSHLVLALFGAGSWWLLALLAVLRHNIRFHNHCFNTLHQEADFS